MSIKTNHKSKSPRNQNQKQTDYLFFNMDISHGLDQVSLQPKHVLISHEFANCDYRKQRFDNCFELVNYSGPLTKHSGSSYSKGMF